MKKLAKIDGAEQQADDVRRRRAYGCGRCENGTSGARVRSSQITKNASSSDGGREHADRPAGPPADVGRLRDPVDEQREAAGDRDGADDVEAPVLDVRVALGHDRPRERQHDARRPGTLT